MSRARILAFAQLLRLPNVFTAFADIALATAVGAALLPSVSTSFWFASLLLAFASGSLYLAGMVWNDVFDRTEDAEARAFRPIPSGRVSVRTATVLGVVLLALGLVFAGLAGLPGRTTWTHEPLAFATGIAVAVLMYDGGLKRTPIGPVAMASCRFLNVLLGLSILPDDALGTGQRIHLAGIVGVYIVGVTWFARTEEGRSNRRQLVAAAIVMGLSLVLALILKAKLAAGSGHVPLPVPSCRVRLLRRASRDTRDPIARFARSAGRGEALRARARRARRGAGDHVRRVAGARDPFVVAPGSRRRKMGLLDLTRPGSSSHRTGVVMTSDRRTFMLTGGAAVAGILNPVVEAAQINPPIRRPPRKSSSSAHEAKMKPLEIASNIAWWNANISGKDEDFKKKEEAQNKIDAALADPKPFATLKASRPHATRARSTTRLSRGRSTCSTSPTWKSRSTGAAQEDHGEGQRGRAGVQRLPRQGRRQGDDRQRSPRRSSRSRAIRRSARRSGRRAKVVGEVGRRRPRRSSSSSATRRRRKLGFKNFHAMMLTLNEQDGDELIKLFDELDELTREPFAEAKAEIDERLAKKCRREGRRADAVALPRSVLPGIAGRLRREPRRALRQGRHR